jgi:hypothetical protein
VVSFISHAFLPSIVIAPSKVLILLLTAAGMNAAKLRLNLCSYKSE